MWFCDMRQMPRWRDIAYEFTVNIVKWFCETFGPRGRPRPRPPVEPAAGRWHTQPA